MSLEQCSFCEEGNGQLGFIYSTSNGEVTYFFMCSNCHHHTATFDTIEEAVEDWNCMRGLSTR